MAAPSKLVAIAVLASLLMVATPAKADYPYCEVVVIESDGTVNIYPTCLKPPPSPPEPSDVREIVEMVRDKLPI